MSYGVGGRLGSDLAFLWLWCRPAATALILPLAWELPYAMDVALKRRKMGVPVVAHRKRIQLGTMRLQVRSLVLLIGLRMRHCHKLWYRSQTRLGSGVAVAVS